MSSGEPSTPTTEGYNAPKKESIDEILKKDTEDESLKKYKEMLLGQAAKGVPKTDDPRRVVICTFGILFPNGEHGPIIRELDTKEQQEKLKETPIVVKEGVDYQFQVEFKVQHDIVSALKFVNSVGTGLISSKSTTVMGSYAPRSEKYVFKSPVSTAPSGALARGKYTANTKFIDDDKLTHLQLNYTLMISKNFA